MSLVKTIVCATFGFIIDSCPSLTTCVIFGELGFNSGMYGYLEIFTDPCYHKQILVLGTAHIGNYGVHDDEVESSNVKVAGIVVRNFSSIASRVDSSGTLQADLEKKEMLQNTTEMSRYCKMLADITRY